MIAPAVAAQNVSRTAVNTERARAVGTAPSVSVRAKQPVVAQRGGANSGPRAKSNVVTRGVAARTAVVQKQVVHSPSRVVRAAHILSDAGDIIIRRALGISRAASNKHISRSATKTPARSALPNGLARATAVFSDISKMGDSYNRCRESYNTCMDQFCANMNDTYRRCFCSDNFRNLRDKEEALDTAATMLAKFEDNNLNAVSLSAAEVDAMYSATVGEQAIKNDTTVSAALLGEIGDLLSGKKKANDAMSSMTSLTGLTIDFSSDLGDIWSSSSDSLFNDNTGVDLTAMEGTELYNNAHNQCMQLMSQNCDASAVKTMTKSAYSVLITQDCNAYQKRLDTKTEKIKQTVRQAEKMLREARLEEYRAHNSADVNECMDKVEKAILSPTACGADYVKCLDFSGVYINTSTGDPIYSARLFKLNEVIQLDGSSDVLSQNYEFNKFLDSKRMYAASALDTCRTIADTVWTEFKRNALIKISQAQDEKIEEVKMSCVSIMKDCYDTQSGALKSFDDTTSKSSAALAARASREMCSDKVLACATLYGDNGGCKINTSTNKVESSGNGKCGLQSLLNFVSNVDSSRIAEGCGTAIDNYLKEICTPTTGNMGYPWNCRLRKFTKDSSLSLDALSKTGTNTYDWAKSDGTTSASLQQIVLKYAYENCGVSNGSTNDYSKLEPRIQTVIGQKILDLHEQLSNMISNVCEESDGIWISSGDEDAFPNVTTNELVDDFYIKTFGETHSRAQSLYDTDGWGKCVQNTVRIRCESINLLADRDDLATYDATSGSCVFTLEYYKQKCQEINGLWYNDMCYVRDERTNSSGGNSVATPATAQQTVGRSPSSSTNNQIGRG